MDFKRNTVIGLYLSGQSKSAILKEVQHLEGNKMFVSRTINRYNDTGSVKKRHGGGSKKSATNPEMIRKVKARIEQNPRLSATKMAKEMNISDRSIRRIMKNHLHIKPYKIQKAQEQSVKASVSTVSSEKIGQNTPIVKRKTPSNNKIKRNQSTDVNTSDVQAIKECLGKNAVASSKQTSSKRRHVESTNSKDSSINSPSTSVQNPQILKSPSKIEQNQSTDYMDDEFDIFAKHIAFQLRQMPFHNAVQCQEKIERIINQEVIIVQQSSYQEIETVIIKQEPGLSEEEPLHSVSGQETNQTITKEEPVINEDEYLHPVLSRETIHTILNQESATRGDELSDPVLGQETMINKKTAISEKQLSDPVSGQETIQIIKYNIPPPMSSPLPVIKTENLSWVTDSVTPSIKSVDF